MTVFSNGPVVEGYDAKTTKDIIVDSSTRGRDVQPVHFNNWPNEAGFNASAELRERTELPTHGRFPSWVAGSLYRTGPGMHKVPTAEGKKFACSHWFDGFTTTYKFDIVPGGFEEETRVYLTARQQEDELIERARKTGKLTGITFGQKRDPCDTFWKKFKTTFEPTMRDSPGDVNIGVTVRAMPGDATKMIAATDTASSKQFDSKTLEPLGITDQRQLHPSLKGPLSGAHAQFDPLNGDCFNYNLELGPKPAYRVFKTSAQTGKTEVLASITGVKPAYIHSMHLTGSFAILCVWPQYLLGNGVNMLWERNVLDAMKFDPAAQCTWLVVDRRSGRGVVKRFTSKAMFVFHTVNAWEEKRGNGNVDVFCELIKFKNSDILHKFYYENMTSAAPGAEKFSGKNRLADFASLARFKLSDVPISGPVQSSIPEQAQLVKNIADCKAGELPTINPSFATKPHRYVYGVVDRGRSSFIDGLCKTDTQSEDCVYWERQNHTPGEPIFLANPKGEDEDDGVLLTVVLDGDKGTSYLLCLDAKSMTEIGRAEWDHAVGFGFHGLLVPSSL